MMLNNTSSEFSITQVVQDVREILQYNQVESGGFGGGSDCCTPANDPAFDISGKRFEIERDMFGNHFMKPVINYGDIHVIATPSE